MALSSSAASSRTRSSRRAASTTRAPALNSRPPTALFAVSAANQQSLGGVGHAGESGDAAVSGHNTRADVLNAVRALLLDLLDRRHPLSGLDERSIGFFRTVARSSTLIARARQLAADVQQRMMEQLEGDGFNGDAALVAAFITAGYTRVLIETATELLDGFTNEEISEHHRARIERFLRALDAGVL